MMMKMMNSGERFDFLLPDGKPQRGKQLFDLLPQIANSATYIPGLTYKKINRLNEQRRIPLWKNIREEEFFLSINDHLENGHRIEDWLPDLPVTWKVHYHISLEDCKLHYQQKDIIGTQSLIGIYCSSYAGSRNWGTWTEKEWTTLIKLIHEEFKGKYKFVLIGADWDVDLTEQVRRQLHQLKIPYYWQVGQPLGITIEVLKSLDYFIGFPSGLSIINESLEKDGIMFYSEAIKKIINTWANPERIKNGNIKECVFCEPKEIFKWILDNNKLL